jgi:hypothetical protein
MTIVKFGSSVHEVNWLYRQVGDCVFQALSISNNNWQILQESHAFVVLSVYLKLVTSFQCKQAFCSPEHCCVSPLSSTGIWRLSKLKKMEDKCILRLPGWCIDFEVYCNYINTKQISNCNNTHLKQGILSQII